MLLIIDPLFFVYFLWISVAGGLITLSVGVWAIFIRLGSIRTALKSRKN